MRTSRGSQLNEMLDTGLVEVQNHSYNLHAYTPERHGCMQNRGESDAAYTPSCCAQTSSACRMSSRSTPAARRTPLPIPTASTAT